MLLEVEWFEKIKNGFEIFYYNDELKLLFDDEVLIKIHLLLM
jgi:hypothetical protein